MKSYLGDFTDKVRALLIKDKLPLTPDSCFFGSEGVIREIETGPFIQVLHDPGGDQYDIGYANEGIANRAINYVGVFVSFRASSNEAGATDDDHVHAVMSLVDEFIKKTIIIAPSYKLRLRAMKGALIPVDPEDDSSQPDRHYELRFQLGRGMREKPAATIAGPAKPKQRVIVSESDKKLAAGVAAAVVAAGEGLATVTGLADVDAAWLGLTLATVGAASSANNGKFRIHAVVDPTTVQVTNDDAVAPDANNGAIAWVITRSEIATGA